MEKRTILAIALSLLVLMAYEYVNRKYMAPVEPAPIVEESKSKPEKPTEQTAKRVEEKAQEPSLPVSETDTEAEGRQEILIRGDLYHAVLFNKGAVLQSWILNDYKSSKDKEFEMIAIGEKGEKWSSPGSVQFDDPDLTKIANEELYEVTVNGAPYSGLPLSLPAEADVVMTLRRGGLVIQKTFRFNNDNYTVDMSATFKKDGKDLEGKMLLAQDICPIEEHLEGRYRELKAIYFDGKKVQRESAPKTDKGEVTISGNIGWVGLDTHYFTDIAIPEKSISSFEIRGYEIEDTTLDGEKVERSLISLKIPVDGSINSLLYLGPKKQSNLKAIPNADLSGVIDYGMFSILARPLLSALRWIHQYVKNYGLAIIILTLILSILLFPLRLKQMLSMKKMQVIQPKVKAVQERYKKYKKTDPKRADMNKEIMALYKEHNVNPMAGCLPLLVQMPLLFAFYRLLSVSIELRQAPFIFWIHDLSMKDPFYVLPIVMGITMFISQKMTPMAPTADSSQTKMMQYLPVIFTFMFLTVSSGLNLYFLCSNIFQVGFQKIAEKWMGNKKKDGKKEVKKIGKTKRK
jgi:YidC/Oxa1 family membrane protein insertase